MRTHSTAAGGHDESIKERVVVIASISPPGESPALRMRNPEFRRVMKLTIPAHFFSRDVPTWPACRAPDADRHPTGCFAEIPHSFTLWTLFPVKVNGNSPDSSGIPCVAVERDGQGSSTAQVKDGVNRKSLSSVEHSARFVDEGNPTGSRTSGTRPSGRAGST